MQNRGGDVNNFFEQDIVNIDKNISVNALVKKDDLNYVWLRKFKINK